jgi:alginate O-acetyltransferase complex protein AlgI
MLLGGLWHGASWTFVAWGAFHGAMLAFERSLGKRSPYGIAPKPVRIGLTFVLVLISWVFFRCETFSQAAGYLGAMFGLTGAAGGSVLLGGLLYTREALAHVAVCAALAFAGLQAFDWVKTLTWAKTVLLIVLFAVAVLTMFTQAFNPFLYFQF